MKNKEKYYDEIMETFCNRCTCEFKSKHVFKSNGCENIRCLDCGELTRQWLESEYVEPIRLTRNEKAILESLPKEYKWITRNIEHALLVHSIKPQNGTWYRNDIVSYIDVFNHLFDFIEAGNSKPYSIEELLKCEVVDDVD